MRLAGWVAVSALICNIALAQPGAATAPDNSLPWAALTVAQKTALAPLKSQWSSTDATRKAKWLVVAERFPAMSADERQRLQARMTEWARLSPQQRGQVRFQYRDARALHPTARKESWLQYQALPPEQKQALQNKAVQDRPARSAEVTGNAANARQGTTRPIAEPSTQRQGRIALAPPTVREAAAPRVVSPIDVQGGAGATTTLLNRAPAVATRQATYPPQRPGILALPPHVDRRTLLPTPQGPAQRLTQQIQKPASASGSVKQ